MSFLFSSHNMPLAQHIKIISATHWMIVVGLVIYSAMKIGISIWHIFLLAASITFFTLSASGRFFAIHITGILFFLFALLSFAIWFRPPEIESSSEMPGSIVGFSVQLIAYLYLAGLALGYKGSSDKRNS